MQGKIEQIVKVKVKAGAARESFTENKKGGFDISVKETAEGNRANKRVTELVAKHVGVDSRAVHIVSGHHRSSKLLRIVVIS